MKKRWDLIARFVSGYDPDVVHFVKMDDELHLMCSCGGSNYAEGLECRHISYAREFVVDESGTISLKPQTPRPPKKYLNRKKQMHWWVERNVQEFMLD